MTVQCSPALGACFLLPLNPGKLPRIERELSYRKEVLGFRTSIAGRSPLNRGAR